jgi:hypothetical protein
VSPANATNSKNIQKNNAGQSIQTNANIFGSNTMGKRENISPKFATEIKNNKSP